MVLEYKKHWSSKICKMLETLENIHTCSPGAKVIVFSQWEALRCHVSRALNDRSVKHLSLVGNIFDRSRTLEQFRSDPSISLLLLSLEDSASGTNLTVASHVFLLHPMLAPSQAKAASFEAQAVGRSGAWARQSQCMSGASSLRRLWRKSSTKRTLPRVLIKFPFCSRLGRKTTHSSLTFQS